MPITAKGTVSQAEPAFVKNTRRQELRIARAWPWDRHYTPPGRPAGPEPNGTETPPRPHERRSGWSPAGLDGQ